ncbi:MAG: tyrosine-type recombinase/integrase [Simkania sp.]|nr:tyrosine-type recombinase/integrase [Simkania sp.]
MKHWGKKPKDLYPRLVARLKNYTKGSKTPVKRAKSFTAEQVLKFMQMPAMTRAEIQIRCCVALSFYGGLRTEELRNLRIEDVTQCSDGKIDVTYRASKSPEPEATRSFSVPLVPAHGNVWTNMVSKHLENLKSDLGNDVKGAIARRTGKVKFTQQVLGKNSLYNFPKKLALDVGIPAPEAQRYTGHSLRRTSAKCAADQGANTFMLRRHFGWRSEQIPQRYVDNSEANNSVMAAILSGQGQPLQVPIALAQTQVRATESAAQQRIVLDININISK